MMRQEFDNMMVARFGWTFPESHYPMITSVYVNCHESKEDFVKFCGEKDLNGIETLHRYGEKACTMAHSMGLTIFQVYKILKLYEPLETSHVKYKKKLQEKNDKLLAIRKVFDD